MGKEADQAVVAVLHLHVYRRDICEVHPSPARAGTAICLLEEAFTVVGGENIWVRLMFPSQFRPILDVLDPEDFALMMGFAKLGACLKAWMGDSEKIPFSIAISTEDDFLDRFQGRKACENQRYTIDSRVFFLYCSNSSGGGGVILSKM